jgi:hypothetical protein
MPSEDSSERRRRHTLSDDTRGQTLEDFLIGVSLFLVTLTFVFGLYPGLLEPFSSGVSNAEKSQANRMSRSMVLNLSDGTDRNRLNSTELQKVLDKSESELRERYGLPETASINVTVRKLDGQQIVTYSGTTLAGARDATNQSAATAARVITLTDDDDGVCEPGCRLVVKIW